MKIALDPYMDRHLSLEELPRKVAELGYDTSSSRRATIFWLGGSIRPSHSLILPSKILK